MDAGENTIKEIFVGAVFPVLFLLVIGGTMIFFHDSDRFGAIAASKEISYVSTQTAGMNFETKIRYEEINSARIDGNKIYVKYGDMPDEMSNEYFGSSDLSLQKNEDYVIIEGRK